MASALAILGFGSYEHHGPHLPPDTDTLIAQGFLRRLKKFRRDDASIRYAPVMPIGASDEHQWNSDTVSTGGSALASLALSVCKRLHAADGVSRFLLINCHGGNSTPLRTVCDSLMFEEKILGVLVNPVTVGAQTSLNSGLDVHGGLLETSVMLALVPDQVHLSKAPVSREGADGLRLEFDWRFGRRGVYWPWTSDDARFFDDGVLGRPSEASAEFGDRVLADGTNALGEIIVSMTEEA